MSDKATLQSLFNTSLNHIRKQGKQSNRKNENGKLVCCYKSADGYGCAAAPFITNYDPMMDSETMMFDDVCTHFPQSVVEEAKNNSQFVRELQRCHDKIDQYHNFMEYYEVHMKNLARDYGLEYSPMEAGTVS